MSNYHVASQAARTAFVEICAEAGSTTVRSTRMPRRWVAEHARIERDPDMTNVAEMKNWDAVRWHARRAAESGAVAVGDALRDYLDGLNTAIPGNAALADIDAALRAAETTTACVQLRADLRTALESQAADSAQSTSDNAVIAMRDHSKSALAAWDKGVEVQS